ncbi:MAG: hypothetical protein PUF65_01300 [Lachnospiraceae bacterium]|nr:hypothetical protein [Lachnospiraceae bacterium]
MKNRTGVYGIHYESVEGKTTVSQTRNCEKKCPYGYDRAFCFPCYKKLMEEMRSKRKE